MNHIPNTLREHRRKMKLTQTQVAQALGLQCTDRISKWEQGLTYPHIVNLFKLAKLYGVQVEELYENTDVE